MSLVGNLADLGLGEILQIVQLSQKSGTLQLATHSDSGSIVFSQGKVLGAMRERFRTTVAEVLVEKQVIRPLDLQEMLRAQKEQSEVNQPPGLWAHFQLDETKIETALKTQIEQLIFSMFEWEDGTFGFVIAEDMKPLLHFDLTSNRFVTAMAINPQFLAMEALRLRDEKKRDDPLSNFLSKNTAAPADTDQTQTTQARAQLRQAMAVEDAEVSATIDPLGPPITAPLVEPAQPVPPNLVIIDDDPALLRQFETRFASAYTVHSFSKVELGLKGVRELLWAQKPVLVVADLIISRSDGGGILGGIEVLEKLRPDNPTLPIVLISDYPNQDAKTRADQLQASGFLIKPARQDLDNDPSLLLPFFGSLEETLMPTSEKTEKITPLLAAQISLPVPSPDMLTPLGRELTEGIEEGDFEAHADTIGPGGGELGILKSLLMELVNPSNKETVTLLVLRYAAEIFSRSVLLLVARDEVMGLGGYAAGMPNDQFVRLVRTVRLQLGPARSLGEVVRSKQVRRLPLQSDSEKALAQRVGIDPGQPVFIAPLVTSERVAAILLGDNQQLGKDLGDTQGLEIFLLQAGLAMERTLLERRLKELAIKEPRRGET